MSAFDNPTIKTQHNHVSVREFSDRVITEDERMAILESARASSTSCFLQAVTIVRITDPEVRAKMAEYADNQAQVKNAPEFWVFCADYHRDERVCEGEVDLGWTEQLLVGCTDSALMAQNVLTAAEALGMGGCFIGGIRTNIQAVHQLLKLPKNTFPVLGLTFGFPAVRNGIKPRLPVEILCCENEYREPTDEELAAYNDTLVKYYTERDPAHPLASWKAKLDPTLKRERRPFIKDFLNEQGWALK